MKTSNAYYCIAFYHQTLALLEREHSTAFATLCARIKDALAGIQSISVSFAFPTTWIASVIFSQTCIQILTNLSRPGLAREVAVVDITLLISAKTQTKEIHFYLFHALYIAYTPQISVELDFSIKDLLLTTLGLLLTKCKTFKASPTLAWIRFIEVMWKTF